MSRPERKDPPDRLTRLEAIVERLADDVERYIKARSGFNWNALGVTIGGIGLLLPGVVAVIMYLNARIDAAELAAKDAAALALSRTDLGTKDTHEKLASMEQRLSQWINEEQKRNNQLEREMGAAQMIDQLFMMGKLKLD